MTELVKDRPEQSPQLGNVLGLPIHLSDDYTAWLLTQLQQNRGVHIITLNAEMAMQADRNSALATLIRQAELVVPDGAGIVLHFRLRGKRVKRCPGIELAEALLERSLTLPDPCPVFFYGGSPGVCDQAAAVWQQRVPGLAIAGTSHGFLTPQEQEDLRDTLAHLQPRIVLVGLGVPRQEFWIAEHRALCPDAIWIGVGGSFDIWSGTKTRAPKWLRDNNLEWIYRLYQEPWRWRRMMALPHFAWRSVVALIK